MSKFVVDSNVALKWALPEADSDKALSIRDGGHVLIAPDIFPLEIAHVLSKLSRRKEIDEPDARTCLSIYSMNGQP